MSIDTLEQPPIDIADDSTRQKAIDAVRYEQEQKKQEQRELMASSPEVKQAINSMLTIRQELGDPVVAGANVEEILNYTDFDGARTAMRLAFDFRTKEDGSYGERKDADPRAEQYFYPGMTEEAEKAIYDAADVLRIWGDHEPEQAEADTVLVPGCKAKGLDERVMFTKELMEAGKLSTKKIVALGSSRPIDAGEKSYIKDFAPDAETEFDVVVAIFEKTYGVKVKPEDIVEWYDHSIERFPLEDKEGIPFDNLVHKVVGIKGDEAAGRPDIFMVSSAIITDPLGDATKDGHPIKIIRERANSADTFETFGRLEQPEPGTRIVMVTRSIFAFQKVAAVNQLGPRGVIIDDAGYSATHFGGQPDRPHALALEMLSIADQLAK